MKNIEMNEVKIYADAIKQIKFAILQSRYKAATLANKEMLSLYYGVGQYISAHTGKEVWGTGALEEIAKQLQHELPGLRGFSAANLKKMRLFYEEWSLFFQKSSLTMNFFESSENQRDKKSSSAMNDLEKLPISIHQLDTIRQSAADEMQVAFFSLFLRLGFTHHSEILYKTQAVEERIFYIEKAATEFWSVETLRQHLKDKLYLRQGSLPNNFEKAIAPQDLRAKALRAFKDEYLLDFVNIEDGDEADEREIENEIIRNIRKFIMALGADFSFIGNQFRIQVEQDEFFIDLLFFNRSLQSLVAIELKRGKFKAEYLGKMNLYLSALDAYVKQPHENPSIGIILCKEKNDTVVEFSFRDFSKPMGVATYKTAQELPDPYRKVLPNAEVWRNLLKEI